jgi:hypothetical protein
LSVFLFLFCVFFGVTQCPAQDVAEAARQERARKETRAKCAKHVYTEGDLAQARILPREACPQFEAQRKKEAPGSAESAPEPPDAQALPPDAPLGDVARHYRQQEELQRWRQSADFHLPLGHPVLADPVAPWQPVGKPTTPNLGIPRFAPPAAMKSIAPAVSPEHRDMVTARRGDSLWKLAQQTLGQGRRWRELLAANPSIVNPDLIGEGARINMPVRPLLSSSEKILLRRGDTLSKIANLYFGRADRWACIAQANPRIQNPDHVYEGQEIVLPRQCRASP